jgi:hypothetical protein
LISSFLTCLFVVNFFIFFALLNFTVIQFTSFDPSSLKWLYLIQSSLIVPVTYCLRTLHDCIERIIYLGNTLERSCRSFISTP